MQLLSTGNLVGRLVAGPLSDRVGRPAAQHGSSVLLVVACLAFVVGSPTPITMVALALLGAQYGALSALVPAAATDAVPARRFGTSFGVVFSGWGVAGLGAPVAAAALAGSIGFDGAYAVAVAAAVLSWAAVAAYQPLLRGSARSGG